MIDWLISYPKSGNTWMRALIAAYLRDMDIDLNNMHGTDSDANPKWIQGLMPIRMDLMENRDKLLFRPASLFTMSMQNRVPFMVKTHHMYATLYGMPLFPDGMIKKAFYIIRDPRDVAISLSHHFARPMKETIELMANPQFLLTGPNIMLSLVGSWSAHYRTWTTWARSNKDTQFAIIKYEDLLKDPTQIFTQFLKIWEQPIDDERIKRAVERTNFSILRSKEQQTGFSEATTGSFFRDGRAEQWRDILTEEQIGTIEKQHGDVMAEAGYKLITH